MCRFKRFSSELDSNPRGPLNHYASKSAASKAAPTPWLWGSRRPLAKTEKMSRAALFAHARAPSNPQEQPGCHGPFLRSEYRSPHPEDALRAAFHGCCASFLFPFRFFVRAQGAVHQFTAARHLGATDAASWARVDRNQKPRCGPLLLFLQSRPRVMRAVSVLLCAAARSCIRLHARRFVSYLQ